MNNKFMIGYAEWCNRAGAWEELNTPHTLPCLVYYAIYYRLRILKKKDNTYEIEHSKSPRYTISANNTYRLIEEHTLCYYKTDYLKPLLNTKPDFT